MRNKNIFLFTMGVLLLSLSVLGMSRPSEALTPGDFIRFHVIANSNSEEDQALKLKVRDEILAKVTSDLAQMESIDCTRDYIEENMSRIAEIAEAVIRQQGFAYSAKANLRIRWIPEKTYGTVTFPAGNYEAFTVELGQAAGENWWCVMFPPLCLIGDDPEAVAQLDTSEFIQEKYEPLIDSNKKGKPLTLKFKTAEIANTVFAEEEPDPDVTGAENSVTEGAVSGGAVEIERTSGGAIGQENTEVALKMSPSKLTGIRTDETFFDSYHIETLIEKRRKEIEAEKASVLAALMAVREGVLTEQAAMTATGSAIVNGVRLEGFGAEVAASGGETANAAVQPVMDVTAVSAVSAESQNVSGGIAAATSTSTIVLSEDQVNLLAMAISGESRGEPYEGQVAVGAVILNRLESPSYPDTLEGVLYQKGAFSIVKNGTIHYEITDSCRKAAEAALNGEDPSGGSLFFWNPKTSTSKWIKTRTVVSSIGNHNFGV